MKRQLFAITAIMLLSVSLMMGCGGDTSHSSNKSVAGSTTKTETSLVLSDTDGNDTDTFLEENVPDNAQELLEDALNASMVPEENLTPSGELTNAIINATYIYILEEQGNLCKLRITYPDVKTAFLEDLEGLPETVDEQGKEAFYDNLRAKVENGELPNLETTLELNILEDESGRKYLDWTREAMSATTGGLSDIYYDMLEGVSE